MDYGLEDSFHIDGRELDGLTPQVCFTLGVEWEMVRKQADCPDGFQRPLHSANKDRVSKMLDKRGRDYVLTYMHQDPSEDWMWLFVKPKE